MGRRSVDLTKHARSLSSIAVVVIAALVAGCGGGSDDSTTAGQGKGPVPDPKQPVTISFASWVGGTRGMKVLYKKFQKAHPNIKVEFQEIPSEEARRKLTTQIAGGNAPDSAYLDAGTVTAFAARNALVNLDSYVKRTETVNPDDFVEAFRQTATYQGKTYALPLDGESTGLFYRKDLFEAAGITEPPKTWEEFEADAKKLTQPDKKQYGFALFAPSPESAYYWYPWLWQAGGDLLSDDEKKIAFDSDAGRTAADFYIGLTKYAPKDFLNSNSYDGRIAFSQGKVGMYVAGGWLAGVLAEEFPKIDGKWATAPLPEGSAGCKTTIAGDNLALFSGGKNHDAAWTWIEFLTQPENMKVWTFDDPLSTAMPTRTSLLESPELVQKKPVLEGFAKAMKCGVPPIANPNWVEVEEVLSEHLGKSMYGDESPSEALEASAKEGQQILDK
jgi:multiple sugar transport system substrate-binding protein